MKRATPGAMMLMAKPDTMWLTPNVDGGQGVQQAAEDAADDAADDRHPRAPLPAPPAGEDRAHDHHALEADVHGAAALGEQAGEAGEGDRRRRADHHAERARRRQVAVVADDPRPPTRRARRRATPSHVSVALRQPASRPAPSAPRPVRGHQRHGHVVDHRRLRPSARRVSARRPLWPRRRRVQRLTTS